MRGYKKLIKGAREYLKSVEENMKSFQDCDDKFYAAMKEFYDFFAEINNFRHNNIDEFILPDDIEQLLEKINTEFKIKNFKDDKKAWLDHIEDGVVRLMNLCDTIPDNIDNKGKRIIKDSVERHYRQLEKNIDYYEKKLNEKFDPDDKQEMKNCVKKLKEDYNIYVKTKEDLDLGPLNITFVDFDSALDLYEQIKICKHWKRKQNLQKQLDKMIEILKRN